MIGVARTCNLIVLVLDALKPLGHKRIIEVTRFLLIMDIRAQKKMFPHRTN